MQLFLEARKWLFTYRKLINFVSKGREETRTTKILFKIVLLRAKSYKLHCHEDT